MERRNTVIARNTIFLTIRMIIVLIISLFTTRIVLNSLGVVDYGIYNVVCGFVAMFAFLNTSMTNGIQRFYNFELGKSGGKTINEVFVTACIIQGILALFILLLTESIGTWYIAHKMVIPPERLDSAKIVFQISIFSFLFVIMQSPFSALAMAHERMDFYAIISVLDACLKLGIAFYIASVNTDKLVVFGVLHFLIHLFNFGCYFIYDRIHFRTEVVFRYTFNKDLFKSMFSFSGWNVFGSFSNMMKEQGISLLLNLFFGPVVNAARGVANQVNGAVKNLVANLSTAVRPQIIQSYASDQKERTMSLTYSISKIGIAVLYLVALPMVLEIDYILKLWLGDTVPDFTNVFIKIIILTSFVDTLNAQVSGVIHASGRMMLYQVVTSLVALLCFPFAYFALKAGFAPSSALWCVFAFNTLAQIVSLFIMRTVISYSIKDYLSRIVWPFIKLVIFTFPIPVLINYLLEPGLLRLAIVFMVSFVIIVPSIYFFTLSVEEKQLFKEFVSKLLPISK